MLSYTALDATAANQILVYMSLPFYNVDYVDYDAAVYSTESSLQD